MKVSLYEIYKHYDWFVKKFPQHKDQVHDIYIMYANKHRGSVRDIELSEFMGFVQILTSIAAGETFFESEKEQA